MRLPLLICCSFVAFGASAQTARRVSFPMDAFSAITRTVSPVSMATELCTQLQFKYAQLMDREVESITNISLFSFIEEWWATKYRYGGKTKKGIDCSGFTGLLMQAVFHFDLPRTAAQQYAACIKLTKDEMVEGDLVFFNTRGGISHVGVYLGADYFVHSSCAAGVTISSLNDSYYSKRFKGAGRVAAQSIPETEVSDYL